MKTKSLDRKALELLVLGCLAHEEISMGRAVELLGWGRDKIELEMDARIGTPRQVFERIRARCKNYLAIHGDDDDD